MHIPLGGGRATLPLESLHLCGDLDLDRRRRYVVLGVYSMSLARAYMVESPTGKHIKGRFIFTWQQMPLL